MKVYINKNHVDGTNGNYEYVIMEREFVFERYLMIKKRLTYNCY